MLIPIIWFLGVLATFGNACFVVNILGPNEGAISPVIEAGRYPPNLNCTYTITQYSQYGMIYQFTKMDLELDDNWRPCKADLYSCTKECSKNDWVAILESPSGHEVVRRCGHKLPTFEYRTPGPGIIWFHTDKNIQFTGFSITFKVDPDTKPCTSTSVVSGEASGKINSYVRTLDGKYRANEDCKWKITVPSNYDTIKITFQKVEVEGSCSGSSETCDCPNDWVSIYDGDSENAKLLTKRCGFSAPSMAFYTTPSKNPTAFVQFKTDEKVQYAGWEMTYEGCVWPCGVTTTTPTTTTTPRPVLPWPRTDALQAFWPLDRKNKLQDVSKHNQHCAASCNGVLHDYEVGPFGDDDTSYHVKSAKDPILISGPLKDTKSFTIAFFVRIPSADAGGIMSFVNDDGNQLFAIDTVSRTDGRLRPQLRIRGAASAGNTSAYGPYDVIRPDVWTFLAVAFDGNFCTLTIYGQYGELYMASYKENLCQTKAQTKRLRLGVTSVLTELTSLSTSAGLSCVSVYSAALPYSDLVHIHEACRVAHGSAPCGSPRLPLPTIPSDISGIAMSGQFPYVASLRRLIASKPAHICSAAIIDRYHLLTAATCFADSKDPFDYTIAIGEHDLGYSDTFERVHYVRKIIAPEKYNITYDNIAVVEVSTPIDMKNPYVNSICLPESDDAHKDDNAYFFGWGSNGRPSGASTTLPRFVSGLKTICSPYWGPATEGMNVCFQSVGDPTVPCNLDEGGPLLAAGDTMDSANSRLIPIGVYAARMNGDCKHPAPSLFADLALFDVKSQIACNIPGFFYPEFCPISYA